MNVRTEASQFHLLTLACLDRQRVRIHPFISRHLGRLRGVSEDVEDGWFVDNWQKGHTGHDLLEDRSNFGLNLFLGLCRNSVPGNGSRNERSSETTVQVCSLGVWSLLTLGLDKVYIKHPPLKRRAGILRDNCQDELSDRSGEQPFWDISGLLIIYHTVEPSNTYSVSASISYPVVNKDKD